jgi:hypothetical protein
LVAESRLLLRLSHGLLLSLLHRELLALRQTLRGQHLDVLFLQQTALIIVLILRLLSSLREKSLAQRSEVGIAETLLEERVLLQQRSLLFLQQLDLLLQHELLLEDRVVFRLVSLIGSSGNAGEHVGIDAGCGPAATARSGKTKACLLALQTAHVEPSTNGHGSESVIKPSMSLVASARLSARRSELEPGSQLRMVRRRGWQLVPVIDGHSTDRHSLVGKPGRHRTRLGLALTLQLLQ